MATVLWNDMLERISYAFLALMKEEFFPIPIALRNDCVSLDLQSPHEEGNR
jgi:hypothetical protein